MLCNHCSGQEQCRCIPVNRIFIGGIFRVAVHVALPVKLGKMAVVVIVRALCHIAFRHLIRGQGCIDRVNLAIDIFHAAFPVSRNIAERNRIIPQQIIKSVVCCLRNSRWNVVLPLKDDAAQQQGHGILCNIAVRAPPIAPVREHHAPVVMLQHICSPRGEVGKRLRHGCIWLLVLIQIVEKA